MNNRMAAVWGPGPMVVRGALVPNPQGPGYATFTKPAPKILVGTTKKMCLCAKMKNAGKGRPR